MNPSLSLYEFLRYGFCGVTLCGAAIFTRSSPASMPALLTSGEGVAIFTIIAFACGAAFYSIYRALLYPLLGRIALYNTLKKTKKIKILLKHFSPFYIPDAELDRDMLRWKNRGELPKGEGKPRLDEWASQVHLLYTLGLSLWLGSIIGVTTLSGSRPYDWLSFDFWNFDFRIGIPVIALLFAAYVSDRRKRFIEEELYIKNRKP